MSEPTVNIDDALENIADLARGQLSGGFTTESDAMFALDLIARLADALRVLAAQVPA
jgi:hypothetical protein